MKHRNRGAIYGSLMIFSPILSYHVKALFLEMSKAHASAVVKDRKVEPAHTAAFSHFQIFTLKNETDLLLGRLKLARLKLY